MWVGFKWSNGRCVVVSSDHALGGARLPSKRGAATVNKIVPHACGGAGVDNAGAERFNRSHFLLSGVRSRAVADQLHQSFDTSL
jgi:hypothetical protein